jgi:ketosteroid isomerase-like protein
MKNAFRLLPLLAALLLAPAFAFAADADDFAAVRRADQRRIVATIAADTAALAKVLSDDLLYAHADGRVQTKAQFLAATAAKKIKYLSVVPQDVAFQAIVDGAVAMNGRARLAVEADGRRLEFTLRFLAVWRKEADAWRLVSYQSSQLAEVPASAR